MMKICSIRFFIPNIFAVFLILTSLKAQVNTPEFIYGDTLPDAPALSKRGAYQIGVRTLKVTNANQIDILNSKEGNHVFYDRTLTIEVWYPAEIPADTEVITIYDEILGRANNPKRPIIPFQFKGRALRDAKPLNADAPFPLIIVSHGYVGSRYLMTYLTENLASKGYIVVSIDHKESTYRDAGPFQSTLLNRPKDILFVLDKIAKMGDQKSNQFLSGLVDANRTGIVGYSMGGYGVLNVGGAGYSDFAINFFNQMTGGSDALKGLQHGNEAYLANFDDRIQAIVALAPWGMEREVWDTEGLKGLKIPTFFVAGSQDDISGYEKGIKAIFEGATHVDRYLLTYLNARHNVAPNPPPPASLTYGLNFDEYYHFAEPAWDQRRINNINQHFITAFLGIHLKAEDYKKYLDLPVDSNDETWFGFKPRTSVGMELRYEAGQE